MEKYTVIIPTRDRAETLEATLRTCLRQTYENFEIIVSDNCSEDNTKEIVDRLNDGRIKYINPGKRLSMSGNFEFALGHVIDGFVMFIGSDDGIMPDAITYVNSIVNKFKVDAVSCFQATYVWPNFFDTTIAGRLTFGGYRDGVEIRNPQEWIKKTLSFESPYCFNLPNLYCGFVKKTIIDKAYKNDCYFRSITPDAYSAFATAIFIKSYAFSYKSFVIAGASNNSNGASALHPVGDNKEAEKFKSENDIPLAKGFISSPSFEICCTEAFASLSQAFPEQCAQFNIDYKQMLLNALKNANSRTKEEVLTAVEVMSKNFNISFDNLLTSSVDAKLNLIRKVFRFFHIMTTPSHVVQISKSFDIGIRDVDDASLVAYAMMCDNNSEVFITNRCMLLNILKKTVGFKKNSKYV